MLTDHKPPAAGGAVSAGGAKILPFRRKGRTRLGHLPPIKDPLRSFEDLEDRRRMQQNLVAALILITLVTTGFWLVNHLLANARIETCIEAGHSNCLPLDVHRSQRW